MTPARKPAGRLGRGLGRGAGYLVLIVLSLFCLLPFAWLFEGAFDPKASLYLQMPSGLTLNNFERAFNQSGALQLLTNSLIMALGAVAIVVVAASLAGYTLSRLRFRFKQALMYGILLAQLIPITATIVPIYTIFIDLHLVDTYRGMILILATYQLPLALWIMKSFFDAVPTEIEEAAWTDGAGRIRTIYSIVVPLALPGVSAAALFTFIGAWGEFTLPLILLSSQDKLPLSLGIYRSFQGYYLVDYGQLTAMSLLYLAPSLLFFIITRRYLTRVTVVGATTG
ncbi:MAG TPA: carbohydrate ABC transporter permease [Chloroflexota bacterium]|nr:carbohydrate ABC transporter permease [Chloroflexota bacterium]